METALFYWPIVFQYDVKAKYRLISRKFSGMKLIQPSVRLTTKTRHERLYPFDKPIKSHHFRSFVLGQTKIALTRLTSPEGLTRFRQIQRSLY